jgi:hypothetical protein
MLKKLSDYEESLTDDVLRGEKKFLALKDQILCGVEGILKLTMKRKESTLDSNLIFIPNTFCQTQKTSAKEWH